MNSQGIDYFPVNVDFFSDDKIELIESEFGIKGSIIVLRLLCKIYHEGYYYQWGDDECLLFAKRVGDGIVPSLVKEVVQRLVKRSFFDEGLFNSFQILTSKGIQTRWLEAVRRRKEVVVDERFLLADVTEFKNVRIKRENVDISIENADISKQSKVKESKVKESKERKPTIVGEKKDELSFAPPPSPDYLHFLDWINANAPWCAKNLNPLTEEELVRLKDEWEVIDIAKVIKRLENKKNLRKRYTNLYTTIQTWLEYDEEKRKVKRRSNNTQDLLPTPEQQMSEEEAKEKSQQEFIKRLRKDAAMGKMEAVDMLEKMGVSVTVKA